MIYPRSWVRHLPYTAAKDAENSVKNKSSWGSVPASAATRSTGNSAYSIAVDSNNGTSDYNFYKNPQAVSSGNSQFPSEGGSGQSIYGWGRGRVYDYCSGEAKNATITRKTGNILVIIPCSSIPYDQKYRGIPSVQGSGGGGPRESQSSQYSKFKAKLTDSVGGVENQKSSRPVMEEKEAEVPQILQDTPVQDQPMKNRENLPIVEHRDIHNLVSGSATVTLGSLGGLIVLATVIYIYVSYKRQRRRRLRNPQDVRGVNKACSLHTGSVVSDTRSLRSMQHATERRPPSHRAFSMGERSVGGVSMGMARRGTDSPGSAMNFPREGRPQAFISTNISSRCAPLREHVSVMSPSRPAFQQMSAPLQYTSFPGDLSDRISPQYLHLKDIPPESLSHQYETGSHVIPSPVPQSYTPSPFLDGIFIPRTAGYRAEDSLYTACSPIPEITSLEGKSSLRINSARQNLHGCTRKEKHRGVIGLAPMVTDFAHTVELVEDESST